MVSPTAIRSFHTTALRLNKVAASHIGMSNGKQFSKFLLGMSCLYGAGFYMMYEFYYKGNKITKMFREERTKSPGARHGL
jgi:hypothetical protein